jgi:hypothetical protein
MKYIIKCWYDSWEIVHEIDSLVVKTLYSYGQNHKEQVVLTRCRIGHGIVTQSYLKYHEKSI